MPASLTKTDRFYITTPIYYINDVPHLGTAYTTIVADALARYHRARGRSVHFLTGTDEHGEKVEEAARKAKSSPQAHADRVVRQFLETWPRLDIAHDDFIRTTEPRHEQVVADIWKRLHAGGDLYLGEYEGLYCIGCEAYYTEGEAAEGNCPTHQRPLDKRKQPSYFFRLSRYQQKLLDFYRENPHFVRPESRLNEVIAFVQSGLRDLSVSRVSFRWGIPVPEDPSHVIYVWIDALTNYVSALGGPNGDLYRRFWPADVHLIGKDILRFHAVYWPAMLMSAGLPPPRCVFAHGWWSVTGKKISKSLPATRIDPVALAGDVGVDALRYFLLREVPLGMDGDFSYEGLIGRTNADLANDLGNLLNRSLAMVEEYLDGIVPEAGPTPVGTLPSLAEDVASRAAVAWEEMAPARALEITWELVRAGNKYIVEHEPWKLRQDPKKATELRTVLYTVLEAVRFCAEIVAPAMPGAARGIRSQLGLPDSTAARWPKWGELAAGLVIRRTGPLFPRIDAPREKELLIKWGAAEVPAAKPKEVESGGPIEYADFAKLDLRVAVVVQAERVKDAEKLLALTLDLGTGQRQVVAGIAARYAPEQLFGKRVVVVANLKPAKIRGQKSEGMILAAGEKDILGLVTLDSDAPAGTKIR